MNRVGSVTDKPQEKAGSLSREPAIERINRLASSRTPFVFLISFDMERNLVFPLEEAAGNGLFMEMPGLINHSFKPSAIRAMDLRKFPVEPSRYREAFSRVMSHIRYGNTFLLNLTFPTSIETPHTLREIFLASRAPFKLLMDEQMVVFSPEPFIRIEGNTIRSNPMKGTMDASVPDAYRKLATDPKEDAEHHTIVDLIRNDLGMVAGRVRVKRFKYIEKVKTHRGDLLQMSSEIEGTLPDDYLGKLGQMIFTMLPAGSICGAPKKKTLEIIREVEGYNRGFYTGVFGYFADNRLLTAVAIRYIEQGESGLIFKSGGGITHQSQWEREYEELLQKIYVPVY